MLNLVKTITCILEIIMGQISCSEVKKMVCKVAVKSTNIASFKSKFIFLFSLIITNIQIYFYFSQVTY